VFTSKPRLAQAGDVLFVRGIELQRRDVEPLAAKRLGRLFAFAEIACAEQHFVVEAPELAADLEADAAVTSRYECDAHSARTLTPTRRVAEAGI